jgi:DNA helicase II / ATP-dependent DNA helicase PcrA
MVLCRVNAPLVSQCFRFIRVGRKANIQGRDIGKGLVDSVKKLWKKHEGMGPDTISFVANLDDWLNEETRKENAKRNPSEARLISLQDRHSCLTCFVEGSTVNTVMQDIINKIESIFTDDKNRPGIRLSSIHKAKGLEADNVFFLMPKDAPCPHPMARTPSARKQETHLRYVGVTRARLTLTYVM